MSVARVRGPGEPDQACDLVAAAIVEEYVRRDPDARLNIRVSGGYGALFVAGEVLSQADFDVSAVVRRALSTNGITATMEPFIALERMNQAWASPVGTREALTVTGYATQETESLFPKSVAWARQAAQELERRRTGDAEWYWLGSDYTVTAVEENGIPSFVIRAEHVDQMGVAQVREAIEGLLRSRFPRAKFKINPAGEEIKSGLTSRIGSSGRATAMDQYGSRLPPTANGVGYAPSHPSNAASALARSVARELVRAGKGKAVMVQATWLPLEARPQALRIRNERGEDLSALIEVDRFDLAKLPSAYISSRLASAVVRAPFDGSIELPWEDWEKNS